MAVKSYMTPDYQKFDMLEMGHSHGMSGFSRETEHTHTHTHTHTYVYIHIIYLSIYVSICLSVLIDKYQHTAKIK